MTNLRLFFATAAFGPIMSFAQAPVVGLPALTVYSPRVAIQEPVATFAMPVSALRFEPLVDVQARNLAEAQADIVIRGGIFENTGFRVGATALYDPQTGHYFGEIPIAPAMIGAPEILTGSANAFSGWNANAGTVAYGWRAIRPVGAASVGFGENNTGRGEVYQGFTSARTLLGKRVGADVSAAHSRSDGSLRFSEHRFTRYNGRFQLADETTQTDVFVGYQSKFFGWPNLYTPFANVYETENIQTSLVMLNHRSDLGGGDFVEVGGYYRRNKDNYVFNRADAGAYNPSFAVGPAFHTTWVYGAGYEARFTEGEVHWKISGQYLDDELKSSSLVFGRYRTRKHFKIAVVPDRTWNLAEGRTLTAEAGMAYDDTNRNGSAGSPIARVSIGQLAPSAGLDEIYFSYAKTTQTPTYFALNSRVGGGLFRGDPNLDREVSHNVEVGAKGAWGAWSADVALFSRRDERLVDWIYNTSLSNARTASAVDIDVVGVESVVRFSSKTVDLTLGYSALTKDADYGATSVNASFYALNYPRHRLTAAAVVRLGAGWEVRSDSEARIQEKNSLRKSDREALLSSLALYFTPPAFPALRLSLEVENLWNSKFEEVPAVPAGKRQFAVGASYFW